MLFPTPVVASGSVIVNPAPEGSHNTTSLNAAVYADVLLVVIVYCPKLNCIQLHDHCNNKHIHQF
jgi:hypothetical protein